MDIYNILVDIEERIYNLKMKRTTGGYISIDEIQERMHNKEPIPTVIFHTKKTDYIVKARTIHDPKPQKSKLLIKLPHWRNHAK